MAPYEHRTEPVISGHKFVWRFLVHVAVAGLVICLSVIVGTVGYHYVDGQPWLDAMLNASMLLGGMGQIGECHTDGGKVFASAFALYSGLVFVVGMTIVIAPVVHRIMHQLHLEDSETESTSHE